MPHLGFLTPRAWQTNTHFSANPIMLFADEQSVCTSPSITLGQTFQGPELGQAPFIITEGCGEDG